MFTSIRQTILMLFRHLNQYRSNPVRKVDSIVLFTAEQFPRSYERGSIEAIER